MHTDCVCNTGSDGWAWICSDFFTLVRYKMPIQKLFPVTLTLTEPPPPPDFSVTVTPPANTVPIGTKATYTVSYNPINGFAKAVNLAVQGVPPGAVVTFSANPIPYSYMGGKSATINIDTTNAAPGTYALVIEVTEAA